MSFQSWLQPAATATPATVATDEDLLGASVAEVATVAVATHPEAETHTGAQTWRSAETLAIEAWGLEWGRLTGEWRAHVARHPDWRPLSPYDSRCRIAEMVHAWNRCTGQQRAAAEVLDRLAPEDYQDAELMTPGCLGLLVALFLGPAP